MNTPDLTCMTSSFLTSIPTLPLTTTLSSSLPSLPSLPSLQTQRKPCNRVLVWAERVAPDLVFFRERASRAEEEEEAELLVPRKRSHSPFTTSLISRGQGARGEETKGGETGSVGIVGVEMRESAEFAPSGSFNLV